MTLHKVMAQEARIKSISLKNSIYFMTKMKSNNYDKLGKLMIFLF